MNDFTYFGNKSQKFANFYINFLYFLDIFCKNCYFLRSRKFYCFYSPILDSGPPKLGKHPTPTPHPWSAVLTVKARDKGCVLPFKFLF